MQGGVGGVLLSFGDLGSKEDLQFAEFIGLVLRVVDEVGVLLLLGLSFGEFGSELGFQVGQEGGVVSVIDVSTVEDFAVEEGGC